jgi:hypothetical protein
VQGLPAKAVVNTTIPDLEIQLEVMDVARADEWVQLKTTKYEAINFEISVHNRWADVTPTVVPGSRTLFTLADGEVIIRRWQFRDISSTHGGWFRLQIQPLDFTDMISPWISEEICVVSNNLAKQRRRKLMLDPVT